MTNKPGDNLRRPTFYFWLYWGAELRVFVFSGLLDYLLEYGEVVVFTRYVSDELRDEVGQGVEWRMIPPVHTPKWYSRLNTFVNRVHGEWSRRKWPDLAVRDREAERVQVQLRGKWASEAMIQLPFTLGSVRLLNGIQRLLSRKLPDDAAWSFPGEESRPVGPGIFVTGDYLSTLSWLAVGTLKKVGVKSVFYPANWRDIFKGARLNSDFEHLLMWNPEMLETARQINPWLEGNRLISVGSMQFDAHFRSDWRMPRTAFCSEFGLDPARPILCYSAVNNRAFPGEAEIVREFLAALFSLPHGEDVQVLVRLNPAGSDPAYEHLRAGFGDSVVIWEPKWWVEGGEGRGPAWRTNTVGDARLFSNCVEHCFLNVGLPSTVMLDFAARGKPSVCVGYCGAQAERMGANIEAFLHQGIFRKALESGVWPVAGSNGELARMVINIQSGRLPSPAALAQHVRETVGQCDGRVHRRVGDVIVELAATGQLISSSSDE